MKRTSLLSTLMAAALLPTFAAPEFAPVLQDHMVIQRDAPVTIWGSADNGQTVTVEWKGHKARAKVTKGKWQVELPACPADAKGSSITATDGTGSATISDVLVGDVWLASGQSNMEWNISQSSPIPGDVNVNNPQVRILRGFGLLHGNPPAYTEQLYQKALDGKAYQWNWRVCSANAIKDFSAVATYFATRLQEEIKVPVGIICNAKGGSSMEAWIPPSVTARKKLYAPLRGDMWMDAESFDAWSRGRAKQNLKLMIAKGMKDLKHPFKPSYQYEVAIAPIARLNIRGVIWYQGESNADNPDMEVNTTKLKDIIESWSRTFRQRDLPFLMVQLPRIKDAKRPHWAEFREVQARTARELPQAGLTCTIDLGSTNNNVHPPLKVPVGHRLADLALRKVYGRSALPTYPQVVNWKRQNEQSEFVLHYTQELTTTDGKPPRGFVVGDPSSPGSFVEARATLTGGKTITIAIPDSFKGKKKGLTWRYINSTFAEPNLVGKDGALPAFPERPDARPHKSGKKVRSRL